MQDDLLDVLGDSKVFGTASGCDITLNKKTYMFINDFNRATDIQRAEMTRWVETTTFDRQEKVDAVTRLYDEIGISQRCEEKINDYFQQAAESLDKVGVDGERKQMLRQYMDQLLHRNK